jgi:hypothetical protein
MHTQSERQSPSVINTVISEEALDQLFREARTHSAWLLEPVPVELLRKAYELASLGPTSANGSPARFVFPTTPGAKARLNPVLAPGNVDKSMAAPVTVIVAWDTEFHDKLPKLFPQADVRSYFVGNKPLIEEHAFRNSSLQAGYFILAAGAGARLRADVRIRRGQTQRRVFPRRQMESQPALQSRLRRPDQAPPTQSTAEY